MIYVTVKQTPSYRQMTLEELLFGMSPKPIVLNNNKSNTRTYELNDVNDKLLNRINLPVLISILAAFNNKYEHLHSLDRKDLYYTFYTAKKGKGMPNIFKEIFASQPKFVHCDSGEICSKIAKLLGVIITNHEESEHQKLYQTTKCNILDFLSKNGFETDKIDIDEIISNSFRKIDAPNQSLKDALNDLKNIFENDFKALYHTSAFAYVKNRSTVDAIKRHQANKSKWFAKFDLTNFFGSTTIDFVMNQFAMIFPFSEVIKHEAGEKQLRKALELAFLNGGLPQGTPISPIITNIMMIPIDYKLANGFKRFIADGADDEEEKMIYTRYADDFQVSSKYGFRFRDAEQFIVDTLKSFNAPFTIKTEKTRYGSSSGSNWNLGVMLNKDNKITVGHENKRKFQAALTSYILDRKNGNPWSLSEVQALEGKRSYYKMVEGETIDGIVSHIGDKFGVDVVSLIKADLRA